MTLLASLKLKTKLRIPIYFQILLIFIFGFFYIYISNMIAQQRQSNALAMNITTSMRNLFFNIAEYLENKGNFEKLEKNLNGFISETRESELLSDGEEQLKSLESLSLLFKSLQALHISNNDIEKQVFELADVSIGQSNTYLTETSRRLIDPQQRNRVTDIERAVIAGAAVNSDTNHRIKGMFNQVKSDIAKATEMIAFLDKSVENATADEARLKNTPFAQLPAKAREANLKTKEMVKLFIENQKKVSDLRSKIMASFESSYTYINNLEAEKNMAIFTSIKALFVAMLVIILIGTVIFMALALRMTVMIARPIDAMTQRARDIATGEVDMTKRIPVTSKDEIGELALCFNQFLERLQELIIKVKQTSTDIHGMIDDITHSSDDLAQRSNEQAASITETSTTVEEFTTSVRQNTENSVEADMMLTSFNEEIQEKRVLIENVTNTMTEIFESSKKIDNIIKVINDISFQTNLLALNAAVEAARAGEAGRGFAVVAAEVRNLAQKTALSSKSIQEIVVSNVEATQKGVKLVRDTSAFFSEVVDMMGETVNKINHITNASREQSSGIEQINNTIGHMDDISSKNASLVDSMAATAKKVKSSAAELQELVTRFNVENGQAKKAPGFSTTRISSKTSAGTQSISPAKSAGMKSGISAAKDKTAGVKTSAPLKKTEIKPAGKPTVKPITKPGDKAGQKTEKPVTGSGDSVSDKTREVAPVKPDAQPPVASAAKKDVKKGESGTDDFFAMEDDTFEEF